MDTSYTAAKMMLIRHAEQPGPGRGSCQSYQGIDVCGNQDSRSLIPQGWQRAGALAGLFASSFGPLPLPQFWFAPNEFSDTGPSEAGSNGSGTSKRPLETITPLSLKLGLTLTATPGSKTPKQYAKTDYPQMRDDALGCPGVVLISWEHGEIPQIANQILGSEKISPPSWPSERFDMVWVFDLHTANNSYSFNQVPQPVLKGDIPTPIFG